MAISKSQFDNIVTAITELLEAGGSSDARLSAYFRKNRKLGVHDRAMIADVFYTILRRRRFLEFIAPEASPRRLVLACLHRLHGFATRELSPLLNKQESEWLSKLRLNATDNLPMAVKAEMPDWLWTMLAQQYGDEEGLAIARSLQQNAPLDLRVNSLKAQRDKVLLQMNDDALPAKATPFSPLGIRLSGKPELRRHPLFLDGCIEVQDEGSQLLALLVAAKRGEMIADFCAGAGGKTLALGAQMANSGRLYAFDVSAKRLANLKPRLARSGLSNIHPQLIANERDQKLKRLAAKFDRVLVDAPCSGLGTLRRNPELKWRQSELDIAEFCINQNNILTAAAKLVKPGGRLVYATCSLLHAENEAIIDAFLMQHNHFKMIDVQEILSQQKIRLDTDLSLSLFPHIHGTDGFFAAVLHRTL